MGALDPAKILVILVIALVVLGPERLPKVAREIGGMWRELTKMREQVVSEIRDALPDDLPSRGDLPRIPRPTPGAVSGFVSGLMTPSSASNQSVDIVDGDDGSLESVVSSSTGHGSDTRGQVIIHPELGEFSFVSDDPNMN